MYANGKLNGLLREWNSDGKLIYKANFMDHKLHGEYFRWNEKGDLVVRKVFDKGREMAREVGPGATDNLKKEESAPKD